MKTLLSDFRSLAMTLLFSAALLLLGCFASQGQVNTPPTYRFLPLLTGYNVFVPTNATVGLGTSNVLFTTYKGQIWWSFNGLTNEAFAGLTNVNSGFPNQDAFQSVELQPDMNGDVNANASLYIYTGNTNWIPVAQLTNSTSFGSLCICTNWLLGYPSGGATSYFTTGTNLYDGSLTGSQSSATNLITINLYKGVSLFAQGGSLDPATTGGPKFPLFEGGAPYLLDNTADFSCSLVTTNLVGWGVITNLPAGFLTGCRYVYMTATTTPGNAGAPVGALLNMAGIIQPQK